MTTQIFYKVQKGLLACQGFISPKTGEFVEMRALDKLIFTYMRSRIEFFNQSGGSGLYETQATIGEAVGVEWKAAARSLKMLVENGVIYGKKERNLAISPYMCYYYRGVNDNVVFCKKPEKPVDNEEICDSMTPEYDEEFLASINFGG